MSPSKLCLAGLLLAGCAAQSFQPQFAPPAAPKPSLVVADLVRVNSRSERPVAVGLTTDPMHLCAWDLKGGLLWEKPVTAKSAPLLAGDAVVLQEPEGVVVRALRDGAVVAVVDEQGSLLGADGVGERVVVSFAQNLPSAPGGVALVEGDSVRWTQRLELPVGVPALVGGYVVVPWATQRLSVLDANDGAELGRFHYRSSVMGQAMVDDGRLYVGQLGWFPADRALFDEPGLRRAPYTPARRNLPGQPPLLRDGYRPVPDPDNAAHRLQVTWRIEPGTAQHGPTTQNDLVLLRFYRLLFGLRASADEIRWVRTFDHDLVGASMQPGGAWIADSLGQLSYLDPQGETRYTTQLGHGLRVIEIRAGGYTPAAASGDPRSAAVDAETQPEADASAHSTQAAADKPSDSVSRADASLRAQLYAAAALDDDRLAAGRAYAATYLARSAEPQATADLVRLCTEVPGPEPVRIVACNQLAERDNGAQAVLQALRVRASFLKGTQGPPVGALAQAAAKLQLKPAGALLVSHVDDASTATRDLAPLFQALEALGDHSAAASAERFVRLHHAEPEGSELGAGLGAALHALGALHARAQRATLVDIATDELTPTSVREQAKAALVLLDAEPVKSEPVAPVAQHEVQADPRPYALTSEAIAHALAPLHERLVQCLSADESKPHSGRSSLVVDGDGQVESVFVVPASLRPCVEPLLRQVHFPSTRLRRQRITHAFYHGEAR